MLVTRGMGSTGSLVTGGMGGRWVYEVVVVVQPIPQPGRPGGRIYESRRRRTILVDEFDRQKIIEQAVREDEELLAIVISVVEVINGIT